jgi:hypothetical protein
LYTASTARSRGIRVSSMRKLSDYLKFQVLAL